MRNTGILKAGFKLKIPPLILALAVILPWLAGLLLHDPMTGSIASFGAYLMIVSFPALAQRQSLLKVLASAAIFIIFASLGVITPFGSFYFFLFALLVALAQGIAELRGGIMRLPVALAALAYFLTNGQAAPGTASTFIFAFGSGCLWSVPFIMVFIKKASSPSQHLPLRLVKEPAQLRFLLCIMLTALCGCIAASLFTLIHACWLPAAALRVIKPLWEDTRYRIHSRGAGTLLGALAGSIILSLSAFPAFHIAVVGLLILVMLQIGAKNYFRWTFCLTTIALAFNQGIGSGVFPLALERIVLTVIGIAITFIIMRGFSSSANQR